MANKKLPGGRKSAGRVSTSAQKLVALKSGATGIAISELPAAQKLTGVERIPLVQDKETRGATVEQIKELIPAGETGASAYDLWAVAQPEGADKSEAAFLAYMEGKPGKDGDNGADGQSAYQIWFEAQEEGADASEEAYIAFQAGKPGEDGASAYQVWLNAGNKGTEEDFLEWLKVTASVELDPLKTNILKNNNDGLYVNGAHPIIPKMVSTTLNGLLDTRTSLPDGTVLFTLTTNLTNPLKITQLGGVSLSMQFCFEPAYYYLDEQNAHVPFQIFPTDKKLTSSTVTLTFVALMAATPKRVFKLSDNTEVEVTDGADVPFKISVQMLIGTTLSQNGMS